MLCRVAWQGVNRLLQDFSEGTTMIFRNVDKYVPVHATWRNSRRLSWAAPLWATRISYIRRSQEICAYCNSTDALGCSKQWALSLHSAAAVQCTSSICGPNYFCDCQQSGPNSFSRKSLIFKVQKQSLNNGSLGKSNIKHCTLMCIFELYVGRDTA